MLISLEMEQIAVIEKVQLECSGGFFVLSGETGAGKSIIIDAINLVLGERASRSLIRSGAEKASVQALFSVSETEQKELEPFGVLCEDGQLLLSRELYSDGRSVCRINGMLSTAGVIREIAPRLLNIHGQHDNQMLLQNAKHLTLLDHFAKDDAEKEAYRAAYHAVCETERTIGQLRSAAEENRELAELYAYQKQEIEKAQLRIGEEEELTAQLHLLEHAVSVREQAALAYHRLYESAGAHDALAEAITALSAASRYDPSLEPMLQTLIDAQAMTDDVSRQVGDYTARLETDPRALDQVHARLDEIRTLERKYGTTVEAVLERYRDLCEKTGSAETAEERLEELNAQLQRQKEAMEQTAAALSAARRDAAKRLEKEIAIQFDALEMSKMRFSVSFSPCEYGESGAEQAVFFLSSNVGEEPRELSKIASGGELSRIMLALKSVLNDTVETMIFDEIDTGVSGRAAQRIAERLSDLARGRQVLCVTHLPQIAAMADGHFLVQKEERDGRTYTIVSKLDPAARCEEIARMLGGVEVTELTSAAARQMMEQAAAKKMKN